MKNTNLLIDFITSLNGITSGPEERKLRTLCYAHALNIYEDTEVLRLVDRILDLEVVDG